MDIINYLKSCFSLYLFKDEAFKYIQKKVKWEEAFWVTFAITLFFTLFDYLMGFFYTPEYINVLDIVLNFIIGIGFMFLVFYIAHLLFRLVGGKAKFLDFFKIGLSVHLGQTIISVISMIVFILLGLLFSMSGSVVLFGVFMFLIIAYALFILVLTIIVATKYYALTYKISNLKSFFIVIIPIILGILLFIIAIFILSSIFMSNDLILNNVSNSLI